MILFAIRFRPTPSIVATATVVTMTCVVGGAVGGSLIGTGSPERMRA
jgi:hypothetical protein